MIDGGICSYPAHSQLAEAISLGAVVSCVTESFPQTVANLTKIMSSIRAAAGDKVRIIGMNYYVPALSQWRDGPAGEQLARLSEGLVVGYNKLLATVYQQFGAHARPIGYGVIALAFLLALHG